MLNYRNEILIIIFGQQVITLHDKQKVNVSTPQ